MKQTCIQAFFQTWFRIGPRGLVPFARVLNGSRRITWCDHLIYVFAKGRHDQVLVNSTPLEETDYCFPEDMIKSSRRLPVQSWTSRLPLQEDHNILLWILTLFSLRVYLNLRLI